MKKILFVLTLMLALICVLASCEEARSITKSEIVNGELVITYSDGTSENLGKIVGEDGKNGESMSDPENPQGLDFFPLPDGTWSVSAGKALYLEEIVIPATYQGKAVTCIGLPQGLDNSATEEGNCGTGFMHAFNLKKIVLPDSITYIGVQAFNGCEKLTEITLPAALTGIGEDAFNNCGALEYTVYEGGKYLGNAENPYLYLVSAKGATNFLFADTTKFFDEDVFYYSNTLSSVTLPSTMAKISADMFCGCSALEAVTIPNGVTTIEERAFYGCSSLTSITFPNSITTIGTAAFGGCSSLTTVVFESNSQLKTIGCSAFYNTGLTSIVIPVGVNVLFEDAFDMCKMTRICFENTDGWFVAETLFATTGTALNVSDPAANAYNLTGYDPDSDGRDNLGNSGANAIHAQSNNANEKVWKRN